MKEDFSSFYELIKKSNSIVISGHVSPDCDSISSCLALAISVFKKFGKKITVLLEKIPDKYSFFEGSEFLYNSTNYDNLNPDLFIAVDCGSIERLGEAMPIFMRSIYTVNIDHHISNENFAQNNFVDINSSSTSQIIFEILKDLDILDQGIATIIYAGIVFDTCGFKHKSTSTRTHEIAADLIKYNINTSMIHSKVLYHNTLPKAKVLASAINNTNINNTICYSYLTNDDIFNKCSAEYSDVEGISSYLLDIEGIEIAALFYERGKNTVKVSLRSKEVDVNKIASKFNGGGHKLASGITLELSLHEAVNLVISEIKKYI